MIILFLLVLTCPLHAWNFPWADKKPLNIVIHPDGDANSPGRMIYNNAERSITFQWAQLLKESLEHALPDVIITITRAPGQVLPPQAVIQLAHRLQADLVITLHAYQETQPKPQLYLYQYANGTEFITAFPPLYAYPLEHAHLHAKEMTNQWAKLCSETLSHPTLHSKFTFRGPFAIPFKLLQGLKVPACAWELGIKKGMSWDPLLQAMTVSIQKWAEHS